MEVSGLFFLQNFYWIVIADIVLGLVIFGGHRWYKAMEARVEESTRPKIEPAKLAPQKEPLSSK